jgi:hypothetical protein
MTNVIPLNNVTRLDLPVDRVLDEAKTKLTGVILLGYDENDDEYFASTFADGGDVLWLLERCKIALMNNVIGSAS